MSSTDIPYSAVLTHPTPAVATPCPVLTYAGCPYSEKEFVCEALPVDLIGMNGALLPPFSFSAIF
eukprot:3932685-Rhodomonas_salina.1